MANIIVLFEVKPTKAGMNKYLDLAAMLKPMLNGFDGFIRAERFSSLNEEGKLLSMNVWTDEAAVERWRNVMEHRMSQKEGREKLFESYKINCLLRNPFLYGYGTHAGSTGLEWIFRCGGLMRI